MAKLDLIDRTALVADLTARKNAAADPVLQLLFGQVISAVERQPAVNVASIKKCCETCKHRFVPPFREPCRNCGDPDYAKWEAADG